jgi:hypothetical protein
VGVKVRVTRDDVCAGADELGSRILNLPDAGGLASVVTGLLAMPIPPVSTCKIEGGVVCVLIESRAPR